jgi:hypothetical protein
MSIRTSFWVDLILFLGFLIAFEPRFTGLTIHEWYTLCGAGILIIHILSHWDWLVNTMTRFFQANGRVRLNYVIIALIFIGFITIFLSGLMISESVLPTLGISFVSNILWRRIHTLAPNLTLLLVAVHFALHWDWVKRAFVHSIIEPLRGH